MANQQAFGALMAPGLRKVFFDEYQKHPEVYSQIFNVDTSNRQFEVDQDVTGFGLVPVKPEGQVSSFDDPIQGYNQTYVHTVYSLGYRITQEAYEDDLYKVLGKRMSSKLGDSCRYTREIQAASVFNNGFGDVGPDGVSLFNANHPLVQPGLFYANRPSTPVALSQTALQNALTAIRLTVDERGKIIQLKPKLLIVHPSLEFYAYELIKSILKPDGANNNVNSIYNSLDVMVWDFLSSPTAWFIACDKEDHRLQWFNRREVKFKDDVEPNSGDSRFWADYRSSQGYSGWRGVYGSPGS